MWKIQDANGNVVGEFPTSAQASAHAINVLHDPEFERHSITPPTHEMPADPKIEPEAQVAPEELESMDPKVIRQKLIARLEAGEIDEIVDRNPEGYTERTYGQLAQIKCPLLLDLADHPKLKIKNTPRRPWNFDEIYKAMYPAIRKIAREYTGNRPSYDLHDAIQHGIIGLTKALGADKGKAWFAGWSYKMYIRRAIANKAATSGTIKRSESAKHWSDFDVVSTELQAGESEKKSIGSVIPSNLPQIEKMKCPRCQNKYDNPTGIEPGTIDEPCIMCRGGKYIVSKTAREEPDASVYGAGGAGAYGYTNTPEMLAGLGERLEIAKDAAALLLKKAALTPRQHEALSLRLGLDGPEMGNTEIADKFKLKYGTGTKQGIEQLIDKAMNQLEKTVAVDDEVNDKITEYANKFIKWRTTSKTSGDKEDVFSRRDLGKGIVRLR